MGEDAGSPRPGPAADHHVARGAHQEVRRGAVMAASGEGICVDLSGKTALITGGSRGIGRAATLTFARAGARVVAAYKSESEAAQSLRQELDGMGADYLATTADVTKREDVDALMSQIKERFGSLDILVNNAGSSGRSMIVEMAEEEWQRLIDSDLT